MKSQPGDYIGQGQNYDFTPATTDFVFNADRSGMHADLRTLDVAHVPWTLDMYPASGSLAVGTYPNAAWYPDNGNQNGLAVYGDARSCDSITGSFTVKQVAFSTTDGSLENFDGTLIQHCDGTTADLTGELKYDAEPVTTAAGCRS